MGIAFSHERNALFVLAFGGIFRRAIGFVGRPAAWGPPRISGFENCGVVGGRHQKTLLRVTRGQPDVVSHRIDSTHQSPIPRRGLACWDAVVADLVIT